MPARSEEYYPTRGRREPRLMSSTNKESAGIRQASDGVGCDMFEHVECAVIIVSYNSAQHITRLLDSLPAATSGLQTRCIVVDNGSQDETMSIIHSRNDVVAIETGQNLGYAAGINVGRAHIGPSSSLLILNPDLVLEPGAIVQLYRTLDERGVGIAVPMLLTDEGSLYLSLRHEPSLMRALGEALFGGHVPRRPGWLSETIRDRLTYQHQQDVAWAGGAALLISAACNEAVGDWDSDRFFLYSEETDFAMRARRCGYRVRYVPTARARHEGGGSSRSPILGALMAVNRVRYYEKYHRRPATSFFRAITILHYFLRSADPGQRMALRSLLWRSRWAELPGGKRVGRSVGTS
jgi:N-acetylglucosaminyl-diphospho-decaprenol L-rhamnosyltransferase